jgi:hypothetical protein
MCYDEFLKALNKALATFRARGLSEKELQESFHEMLCGFLPAVTREHRLSPKDIPDFTVPIDGGLAAIELKVKGSPSLILRQIKRYADLQTVTGVVLVCLTPLRNLPSTLSGKPVVQISLYRNML